MKVISFHYTVTDTSGKMIDSSEGHAPLTFMEGAGQIIPGLEQILLGLKVGDKKHANIPAAEAYGQRDESLIMTVGRDQMPKQAIHIGDRFHGGQTPDAPAFVVTGISDSEVDLDGNHPLAGQDLIFDVEVSESREATPEEIKHGHAHGAGGHSH